MNKQEKRDRMRDQMLQRSLSQLVEVERNFYDQLVQIEHGPLVQAREASKSFLTEVKDAWNLEKQQFDVEEFLSIFSSTIPLYQQAFRSIYVLEQDHPEELTKLQIHPTIQRNKVGIILSEIIDWSGGREDAYQLYHELWKEMNRFIEEGGDGRTIKGARRR